MKKILFVCTFLFVFFACRKQEDGPRPLPPPPKPALLDGARALYLAAQTDAPEEASAVAGFSPRITAAHSLRWDQAVNITFGGYPFLLVPLQYAQPSWVHTRWRGARVDGLDALSTFCFWQDSTKTMQGRWITCFPDSLAAPGRVFSGYVFVDDLQGRPVTKYHMEAGGRILQAGSNGSQAWVNAGVAVNARERENTVIETCVTIEGYNYASNDPSNGYYWSEPAGCSYTYLPTLAPVTSGGGLSAAQVALLAGRAVNGIGISALKLPILRSGNNVIGNANDYTKCFTNVPGSDHQYQVVVCVDQPVPGTRTTWGMTTANTSSSPIDVGHTFLVFTEKTPTGTITRNMGFYPSGNVNPLSPAVQGQLNNDADHIYNISLTVPLNASQFFAVLQFVNQGNNAGFDFNLNTNNCTSFTLHALAQAGIYLPSTIGSWPYGSGNDPGDLGEDIRKMTLSAGMTRNTVMNPHPNTGTCY